MGIDIIVIREARVDGKWMSCEKPMKQWYDEEKFSCERHIRDESSADLDVGRPRQVMGMLTGDGYTSLHQMDVTYGVPNDVSEPVRMRIEDEDKNRTEWLITNNLALTSKKNYYSCTFKQMVDYFEYWRKDMIETGSFPVDFLDEEGDEKLCRFENGIYKNDTEKLMSLMLSIYYDKEYNPLLWFLHTLNNAPCEGEFKGDLSAIDDADKRIIFWYSY